MKTVSRHVPKEMRKIVKRLERIPGVTFRTNGHTTVYYNGRFVDSLSSSPKSPGSAADRIQRKLRKAGVPL